MISTVLLFPAELWEFIDLSGWGWGYLNLRFDAGEGVITISHIWNANTTPAQVDTTPWQRRHYLHYADIIPRSGVWYRAQPELHVIHKEAARRRGFKIPIGLFRQRINAGWVHPGPGGLPVVAVSTPQSGGAGVSAWRVFPDFAVPEEVSVVDDTALPADFISSEWPVAELDECRVTLIGLGSIGSVVAETLAIAGIGRLHLIDYDRLEQRNLARHRLSGRDLGRFKVHAMRDLLDERDIGTRIEPYPIDIITNTDVLRPIVENSDIVVCAADGVAPRRVANHVARRADKPLVLAAVFEDGAFGEVIRVRQRTGCLHCLRLTQIAEGSFDPEPGIDLGYGTGTTHRPMTAAPSDLQLVGTLAAKMTLSTLLEARGRWHQRLPADYVIIGLQPRPDMLEPFDLDCAGDFRWHKLPARRGDCPTCAPA